MQYISTKGASAPVSFKAAVLTGLPPDRGLYFPQRIPALPDTFIRSLPDMTFQEISLTVAEVLLEGDIPQTVLKRMVDDTLQFDAPLVPLEPGVEVLELFHGPTLAFKDFGARFLARVMAYFIEGESREITVLVATSGDTGSAVASGFFQVPGIRVVILYPSGKVSKIQEKQLTTHGGNITALEIEGTFDDCQRLVKSAFSDKDFEKNRRTLTSANSINIARLIPQSFYYFYAYSRLEQSKRPVIFSVPCGNFGNLTGGILAKRMGLPIDRFIAATNANDVFPKFLRSGVYRPEPSKQTLSNAMDVGDP
ncbi:MAG: threonine synthase, partial [FCB group bacterium]|nr:threonine synthase [FCB group bacterium]